jgi:hypothetical protein
VSVPALDPERYRACGPGCLPENGGGGGVPRPTCVGRYPTERRSRAPDSTVTRARPLPRLRWRWVVPRVAGRGRPRRPGATVLDFIDGCERNAGRDPAGGRATVLFRTPRACAPPAPRRTEATRSSRAAFSPCEGKCQQGPRLAVLPTRRRAPAPLSDGGRMGVRRERCPSSVAVQRRDRVTGSGQRGRRTLPRWTSEPRVRSTRQRPALSASSPVDRAKRVIEQAAGNTKHVDDAIREEEARAPTEVTGSPSRIRDDPPAPGGGGALPATIRSVCNADGHRPATSCVTGPGHRRGGGRDVSAWDLRCGEVCPGPAPGAGAVASG